MEPLYGTGARKLLRLLFAVMRWKYRGAAVALAIGVGAAAVSCGTGTKSGSSITVHAASSLTEVFSAIGKRFEAKYPGTKVSFDFGASSALVRQVLDGAPGDVIATADEATMAKLVTQGLVATPTAFARNRLAIVVAKGNPKGVKTPADLSNSSLTVIVAAPEVPVGRYAVEMFAKAGVTVSPKSLEESAKSVVTKVGLGEADAGVVFITDAKAAGNRLDAVDIPDAMNITATYPVALLKSAVGSKTANEFVAFVLSDSGRAVLAEFGFAAP
jgi:molybdate transport system substrate-binding protein